ncbi:peptidoglycan DD-metalloendopeptidase family protein [Danxiaibacter flavus]|uniref:Peptidoglycan DD-metalloendopeptidase family protein n=1 Tax=Danxiaibacter flavus TaxID=3049108 RepID=A0ABV3ZMU8_9BACT|nr:peptidoglycan DD-metalloendopeptidase family protein [Chitinophagaceae bacterium DXS]
MISGLLKRYRNTFHKVVPFDPSKDKLLQMGLTANNRQLTTEVMQDINHFCSYVNELLSESNALYGIGGYKENRTVYNQFNLFEKNKNEPAMLVEESRTLHLGIDIWGKAGTPVFAPMGGSIHSFANNNNKGDYGATIILQHQLDGVVFHTLYGHLSLLDLAGLQKGRYITHGEQIARFGNVHENGCWPPHLHFQVIVDMELQQGDYPGVCRLSEADKYLGNCPDPDLVLNMMRFL